MNCEQARNAILLHETGELGRSASRRMEDHLAACAECSEFANASRILVPAAAGATACAPGADTHASVMDRAGDRRRRFLAAFPPFELRAPALGAIAAAACLAVVAAVWVNGRRAAPAHDPVQVASSLVSVISGSETEDETGNGNTLRALARDLLSMEGFSTDWSDEDLLIPPADSPAKDPLSHSIPGPSSRICG
ncbi:MAG: zf-HC2 domain-containing protein [Lentisphaerae bacterium]|nr:zf-HC2 domain-containing protein [Lentisphaerota bacterium]